MHCSIRLIVQTLVFNRSYFTAPGVCTRDPSSERRNYLGEKWPMNFCLKMPDFHVTFRDLLHSVNLRHGTKGFTSLGKEGVLRIFSPWKIRRLRPSLNPVTWVPKANKLPLDHWSLLPTVLLPDLSTRPRLFYWRFLNHEVLYILSPWPGKLSVAIH